MVDCTSSRKYYHFIRLMGREASHLTLEVALLTQPNLAFVGEEIKAKGLTLSQVTNQICDLIVDRSSTGMDYGVVLSENDGIEPPPQSALPLSALPRSALPALSKRALALATLPLLTHRNGPFPPTPVPEGLVEFIPEVGVLIHELNELLSRSDDDSNSYEGLTEDSIEENLSPKSAVVFNLLPDAIRQQLLLDRDPHGNVQVAKIESERLLGALVESELATRKATGGYCGKLSLQYHYFGYEGRCPPPSTFDSNYCYGLGLTAAALISEGCNGVMACLQGLTKPPEQWTARGVPLTCMLAVERRKGKDKPVIRKALVELDGKPFAAFSERRLAWRMRDVYASPGPVQYDGPCAAATTMTLRLERGVGAPEELASPLTKQRLSTPPQMPACIANKASSLRVVKGAVPSAHADELFVQSQFPSTYGKPRLELVSERSSPSAGEAVDVKSSMSLGVVFCGRQCPGAHNVVAGLSCFLAERAGSDAKLYGFVGGTNGLFKGDAKRLTPKDVAPYLNSGGMHMLGRSADVIRSAEQLAQSLATCSKLKLDGLILVGGPVSNSDTALLAEYFESKGAATRVIGIPATIDGDLYRNSGLEASIGFDTACKVYASLVGNLAKDAASACKCVPSCCWSRPRWSPRAFTLSPPPRRLVLRADDGPLALAHYARVRQPHPAQRRPHRRGDRGEAHDARRDRERARRQGRAART